MPVFAVLGWAGLFVHNVAELPGQTILSPESSFALLLTAALIILWFTHFRVAAAWWLLALGLLNLAGAVVSVLPLEVLPFDPEQSLSHYAFHVFYGLCQVPVIIAASVWLRRHGTGDRKDDER